MKSCMLQYQCRPNSRLRRRQVGPDKGLVQHTSCAGCSQRGPAEQRHRFTRPKRANTCSQNATQYDRDSSQRRIFTLVQHAFTELCPVSPGRQGLSIKSATAAVSRLPTCLPRRYGSGIPVAAIGWVLQSLDWHIGQKQQVQKAERD